MFNDSLKKYFQRPYPLVSEAKEKWWISTKIGLFIFVFLYGFKPFSLHANPNALPITAGYGIIAFTFTALFFFLVPLLFPKYFQEDSWTVKKELIYKVSPVFFIGLANTFYSMWIHVLDSFWQSFFFFEICTLAIGVFPLMYFIYIIERRSDKRYREISEEMTIPIQDINEPPRSGNSISLKAYNEVVDLVVQAEKVYYIKSSSNYVEVIHVNDEKVRSTLIRNTISDLAQQLQAYTQFYKCHKSYIVNVNHINKISGNARGLKIHLLNIDVTIPVSRSKSDDFKELLDSASNDRQLTI